MSSSAALIVPPSTSTTSGPCRCRRRGSAYRARCSPCTSYVATRPPSRKAEAAVTASVTRPPELPRRSSRMPAPAGRPATASRTCVAGALGEGVDLDHGGAAPGSARRSTVTGSVVSRARRRVAVHARGRRAAGRAATGGAARARRASPRSRATTSVTGRPSTSWPSMVRSTVARPGCPARSAGLPGWTRVDLDPAAGRPPRGTARRRRTGRRGPARTPRTRRGV